MKVKNIGFVSTRLAGSDGVSAQVKKWVAVLKKNHYPCYFMAGELDYPAQKSSLVPEVHFNHPTIQKIDTACFRKTTLSFQITQLIDKTKQKLKNSLYQFQKKFQIDLFIIENAITIPMNIPFGLAITEFIAETGIPTIAHHHDFYWERERFFINAIEDYLISCFPPDLPSLKHVTINSMMSKELQLRIDTSNTIIPNVLDFTQPAKQSSVYSKDLRQKIGLDKNDLFILQPTRIIRRKGIERAIDLVKYLDMPRPILVLCNTDGDEKDNYAQEIKKYAKSLGVELVNINHLISKKHGKDTHGNKLYTLDDIYFQADLITYPSVYEGFGNAFLHAIYFKKPIVINRYPVYIADIELKGFKAIVINGFVSSKTIKQIKELLNNSKKLKKIVNKNYSLAKKYFSYKVLEKKLIKLIHSFN